MIERIYISATGGGAGAQNLIWSVPGCSKYFAGATFPYGHEQLTDFIGYQVEKSVCAETAIEMAMMAYYNAYRYGYPDEEYVGVGATCSLAPNKRCRDEYYVARVDSKGCVISHINEEQLVYTNHTDKTVSKRITGGNCVDSFICSLSKNRYNDNSNDCTELAWKLFYARPYWTQSGKRLPESEFVNQRTPLTDSQPSRGRTIYPGAFNPPHAGHFEIAKKTNAVFSIEAVSPHKGSLGLHELLQRAKLLKGHEILFTFNQSLYVDKSNHFPGCPLVIGADSFVRMLDPKWGPDPVNLLREMTVNDTRIYVVGREVNGKYMSADEAISLVPESATCYDIVPVDGRWDLSSTQLRNR